MPHRLLLDTNTLLLWFIGAYDRRRIQTFKRTAQFTEGDYELLIEVVQAFGSFVTTPHILTEVCNLSDMLVGDVRRDFCQTFARHIQMLDEHQLSATIVAADPVFDRIGMTDTAIAQLAKRHSFVVVTVDLDLYVHLAAIGVDVVNFNHVRSSRLVPNFTQ